jgi:alpha-glucosidase
MPPARRVIRAHTMDQPEVHDAIAAMRLVSDTYDDRVLIGEAYLPIDRLMAYYGVDLTGFHLPFNFHLIATPWNPTAIAALIETYEAALPPGAWPNWVLGNHDRSRVASRIGREQARVAVMLLLTLRGTPTIYQGEELGLTDVPIPHELVQDPWEKNVPGLGLGRDPVRTPMPWDGSPNAGFTTGRPWLPIGPDNEAANVAAQQNDPSSMLSLYRGLLALRRSEPPLSVGTYMPVAATDAILAYERRHAGQRLLIALNFTPESHPFEMGRIPKGLLLSTHLDRPQQIPAASIVLRAHEGVIVGIP